MDIEYRHRDEPDRHLEVSTDVEDVVVLAAYYRDGGPVEAVTIDLDRDGVSALIGQLQSWLARTAATVPAGDE